MMWPLNLLLQFPSFSNIKRSCFMEDLCESHLIFSQVAVWCLMFKL